MERPQVYMTDRIRVTENLLKGFTVKKVLEIGAGDYSFEYIKQNNLIKWIKVDFEEPCNVVCNLNTDNLFLPFSSKKFDLVICTQVLEHLLWPQHLLKEILRVLISGGILLVSIPNISSLTYRLAWLLGSLPSCAASGNLPKAFGSTAYKKKDGRWVGGHVIDFNYKRIINLLERTGFKIKSVKGSGIIWYRQIIPYWLVPPKLSSNIICTVQKD